jgi:predicted TIM-barrel fold metal-dependent hydrolase
MIVDAHVHMGPGLGNHADACLFDAYTGDQLITAMDKAGIDAGIVFAPLWQGGDFYDPSYEKGNEAIFQAAKKYPSRIIGYGRVNPNFGDQAIRELNRCISDYKFQGIMMHPEWESFAANDLNLLGPIFRIAQQHKLPVTFHTGYYPTCQPLLFLPLAEAFPDVPIMLKHMGYEYLRDAIVVARLTKNVLLETAGNTSAAEIRAGIKGAGAEKVVYGSDLPYVSPEIVIQRIQLMEDVSEREKQAVLGGNIAQLHNLK